MKTFNIILILLIGGLLLTGLDIKNLQKARVDDGSASGIEFYEAVYNGHCYIGAEIHNGFGLVHSPDCQCGFIQNP